MSRGKKKRQTINQNVEESKILEQPEEAEAEKPEEAETEKTEEKPEEAEAEKPGEPEKSEEAKEEKPEEPEKSEETKEEKPEKAEAEKPEKAETEKPEEAEKGKKTDLYETEPFIDPSVYRQRRKKKLGKRIGLSVLGLLLLVYAAGVVFHAKNFGTMTRINGIDVSGKSEKQVEAMLLSDAADYCLTVKFKDCEFEIPLGKADSKAVLTESVKDLMKKHSPFLWFVDSFRGYDYKLPYSVVCDAQALQTYMAGCPAMRPENMTEPQDAKVVLKDGEALIIPDETGSKLDLAKVYDKIINAMKQFNTELDLEQAGCYIPAHVLADSESILETKKEADAYIAIDAVYDFGDYSYSIPKEALTTMAYVSSDGSIQISESNVAAYVDKFAEQFSTAGTDREFTTHDNKTILVHGGYYGWVIDKETEAEELYALLSEKKSFTKEPACERRGYTMCAQNDIGSTYVEVDLSNQHVYYYQNGRKKWDSNCVSGQTPGHKTPGGLYGLTYKKEHATLIGEDYETPVGYWMPFNGGIGLHDATWRGKFGGDIYTYSGSHGCVNLPADKAAELYEYVEPGMPVVCYWRDEVTYVEEHQ